MSYNNKRNSQKKGSCDKCAFVFSLSLALLQRMGVLDALYFLRIPFTLFSLLPFVIGVAILESGSDVGQRIAFGVIAILSNLFQVIYCLYLLVRVWSRDSTWRNSATVLRYVDSFFALMCAWGMGSMAFWVIDTTPAHEKYFATLAEHLSGNRWLVAVDFTMSSIYVATAAEPAFLPIHVLSRLYYGFIAAFHFFYLATLIVIGLEAVFKRVEKSASEEMAPLNLNAEHQPEASASPMYYRNSIIRSPVLAHGGGGAATERRVIL